MDSVQKRVAYYEQRRTDILSGKIKPIPFFGMPRLTKYIPGIIPSMLYKVTSHSGVGKTNFSKFIFVYQSILYAIKYKVNFQVIYFALEESEEEFIDGLMIHILKRKYGLLVDRFTLSGMTTTPIDQKVLDALKTAQSEVALMMSYIKVVDSCYTPDAMMNKCKWFASQMGKFEINSITNQEEYIANDPSQVVLVVADHISLIEQQFDKDSNLFLSHSASIARWHTTYCRKIISKQWKWTVLNIQQQSLQSETQQFTSKGDTILAKILPSLDGVANNREVIRDDYVVLGLFSPDRYGLEEFKGYDINTFGDNFRSVQVLKSRFGTPNKILPLYFRGDYNYFEELPHFSEKTKIQSFYDKIGK